MGTGLFFKYLSDRQLNTVSMWIFYFGMALFYFWPLLIWAVFWNFARLFPRTTWLKLTARGFLWFGIVWFAILGVITLST